MSNIDIVGTYDGSNQEGGELAYFVGKQYGSGWLRTLGRFAFPLIKRAVRVAGRVVQDKLDNPDMPIVNSIRDNTFNEVARTVGKKVDSSINRGKKRKRPIRKNVNSAPFFKKSK